MLVERFSDRYPAEAKLAAGPARAALECLGGNSPYLGDLVLREPEVLRRFLNEGADSVVAERIMAAKSRAKVFMVIYPCLM